MWTIMFTSYYYPIVDHGIAKWKIIDIDKDSIQTYVIIHMHQGQMQ